MQPSAPHRNSYVCKNTDIMWWAIIADAGTQCEMIKLADRKSLDGWKRFNVVSNGSSLVHGGQYGQVTLSKPLNQSGKSQTKQLELKTQQDGYKQERQCGTEWKGNTPYIHSDTRRHRCSTLGQSHGHQTWQDVGNDTRKDRDYQNKTGSSYSTAIHSLAHLCAGVKTWFCFHPTVHLGAFSGLRLKTSWWKHWKFGEIKKWMRSKLPKCKEA